MPERVSGGRYLTCEKMEKDNRERFSGKADLYAAGRPSYAAGFLSALKGEYGVTRQTVAADIGSGTGKLTKQLLELGCTVYAVEPNADMRRIAEQELAVFPGFKSVFGDASDTKLEDGSVDIITVAQAFHWFPVEEFRRECLRIGREGCPVFLIWNQRDMEAPVTQALFRLYSTFGKGFRGFNMGLKADDERIRWFFRDSYEEKDYANPLHYDREGFRIRCLSSSHSPVEGEDNYGAYMEEVDHIFDRFSVDGKLEIPNRTTVYEGTLRV